MSRPKQACPACGARTIPIVYGFPSRETWEAEEAGDAVIGGCIIGSEAPDRVCTGDPPHKLLGGVFVPDDDLGLGLG